MSICVIDMSAPRTNTQQTSAQPTTGMDHFTNFFQSSIIGTITEIHALMPDSILFGSLLMYVLTQNIAFGVFTIFVLETIFSHKLISWIITQTVGPSSRSIDVKCRSGYKTHEYSISRIFSHDPYPSYGVFSLTSIATYLGLATSNFSDTMKQMGPEWEGRSMVCYFFIGLVLMIYITGRLSYCDSFSEVVIAFLLAVGIGGLFFFINKTLMGDEVMNFLGLPYMVSKQSEGKDIYVCSDVAK